MPLRDDRPPNMAEVPARRWWVRPALQQREELGHAYKLLPLLRSRDEEYYREFLAAGDTLRSSSFCSLNGRSTAYGIISSTCRAIWEVVGPIYVACPTEPEEWLQIASDFEQRWNLPHCLGAIDGKHVAVECPANSGSVDRNYKNFFSKSLLAISDAYYRFVYVEVGHFGSETDSGVFGRSTLQESIEQNQRGFPPGKHLGAVGHMPYFLVLQVSEVQASQVDLVNELGFLDSFVSPPVATWITVSNILDLVGGKVRKLVA
ncbi:uncharacterized protein LOC144124171 [Amblyomma americanum]